MTSEEFRQAIAFLSGIKAMEPTAEQLNTPNEATRMIKDALETAIGKQRENVVYRVVIGTDRRVMRRNARRFKRRFRTMMRHPRIYQMELECEEAKA